MIKSTAAFASALALFAAGTASAQEAAPIQTPAAPAVEQQAGPLNTVTVNPLGLAFGMLNFEYERAASQKLSWFVGPSYWSFSSGIDENDATVSAYGLSGGIRYFLSGSAPEGFFLSPGLSASYVAASEGDASAVGYSVSAIGGYTWIFGDVFDLSLGLGAQYTKSEVKLGDTTIGYSGTLPAARLALGAAF